MGQSATVLVLAELDDAVRASVDAACTRAGYVPTMEPSAEVATTKLGAKRYDALVVHLGTPGAALACMKARGRLLRTRVPVLALVDEDDDEAFARAYRAGADEVLPVSRPELLTERLVALPRVTAPQPGIQRGDAVVADADRNRAEVLERVLKDAGFRVEVALDGFATRLQAGRPSIKVAIVDASLDDVAALIAQSRTKGSRCAWVVRARPEMLDELRLKLSSFDRVAVVSAYGPPDDVLFETNRLLEARPADGRADARLLHGTILGIEWPGTAETDIGYTYNVSALGLYVRTLAAPRGGDIVLRLLPPGGTKTLRLEGKVAWRRPFGPTQKEPVPAGFGVHIVGGDVDAWTEATPKVSSIRRQMMSEADLPSPQPQVKLKRPPGSRVTPPPGAVKAVVAAYATPRAPAASPAREPLSSVEQMLASVLGGGGGDSEGGAAPLSIDGDAIVELPDSAAGAGAADPFANELAAVVAPPPAHETITVASLGFDAEDVTEPPVDEPSRGAPRETEREGDAAFPDGPTRTDTPAARAAKQPREGPGGPPSAFARTLMADASPGPVAKPSHASDASNDRATMPGDLSLIAAEVRAASPGGAGSSAPSGAAIPVASPSAASPPGAAAGSSALSSRATSPRRSAPPRPAQLESEPPELAAGLPRRGSLWVWLVAAGVVGGGGLAVVLGDPKPPAAPTEAVAKKAPPQAPPPGPPAATAEVVPAPDPAGSAAGGRVAVATSASATSASATSAPTPAPVEPAASPSAGPVAALYIPDPAVLEALPHGHGLLLVASPLSTNVYVYGHLVGTTNQPITSKCGPRFLRLGAAPGAWQGGGAAHVVKCGGFTRVEMPGE